MTTITADVICDSISDDGVRLTTLALTYPRVIHAEFMTHRVFSRNASSSRAIPIERMVEMVMTNPYIPVRWGLNGKGMQDHGEMTPFGQKRAEEIWLRARDEAVHRVKQLVGLPEAPHKQIVNRLLEPWMHITVLVTATNWDNFLWLREHKDAQPEIQALAVKVREALEGSAPLHRPPGTWHLPYIAVEDVDSAAEFLLTPLPMDALIDPDNLSRAVKDVLFRVSAARCARVSYLKHDGTPPSIQDDIDLYSKLVGGDRMHASPLEHQAEPDRKVGGVSWEMPHLHGNFTGWRQFRKGYVGESGPSNLVKKNNFA